MPVTKKVSRQSGARFQIKAVAEIIKRKESEEEDATFERNLLDAWSEYEGWESAKDILAKLGKPFHQA